MGEIISQLILFALFTMPLGFERLLHNGWTTYTHMEWWDPINRVHSKICYLLHSLAASLVNPKYYPPPWKWMERNTSFLFGAGNFSGARCFQGGLVKLFVCKNPLHSSPLAANSWLNLQGSCTVWGDPHISTFDSGLFGAEMAPPVSILSSGDYWLVPWWAVGNRSLQRKKMMVICRFVSSGEKGQVCLCFVQSLRFFVSLIHTYWHSPHDQTCAVPKVQKLFDLRLLSFWKILPFALIMSENPQFWPS